MNMTGALLVYAGICLGIASMLAYGLLKWFMDDRKLELTFWRRAIFGAGLFGICFQVVVFLSSWRSDINDYASFAHWSRLVLPSFLVSAGCVLAGKGPSRWWLLSVSVALFILCFLIVLSA